MTKQATPNVEKIPFPEVFDAAPTSFLVVAPPNWIIVTANRARLEVTGTTLEDQVGAPSVRYVSG